MEGAHHGSRFQEGALGKKTQTDLRGTERRVFGERLRSMKINLKARSENHGSAGEKCTGSSVERRVPRLGHRGKEITGNGLKAAGIEPSE